MAQYSNSNLLAALAALQLVPINGWTTLRLEMLVRLAASRRPMSDRQFMLTRQRLKRLVAADWLDELVGFLEDPPETISTAAVSFDGGSYVVFPGNYPDVVFVAQHVIKALFRHAQDFPDPPFFHYAYSFTRAVLRASQAVATAAGLARGIDPGRERHRIYVPDSETLGTLEQAVRLPMSRSGDEPASGKRPLTPLVIVPGEFETDGDVGESSGVLLRPLVSVDDALLLVAPGSLLSAYVHQLLLHSIACGASHELVARLGQAVWDTVKHCMRVLGSRFLDENEVSGDGLPEGTYEGLFATDIDKVTYVLAVGDSLDGYSADTLEGSWDLGDMVDCAVRHLAHTVGRFRDTHPGADVLCILVVQGVGRVGLASVDTDLLPGAVGVLEMSAADLECIAHLEQGDPLALWKFADAQQTARNRLRFVSMSGALNEFALYRASRHSLSLSQAAAGTTVLISPGESLAVRVEFQRMYDPHAVASFDDEHVEEVIRRHQWGDIPIYWRKDPIDRQAACMVSGYALPVWVVGPEAETEFDAALSSELVDTLAYWLWQFTPSLAARVDVIAEYRSSLALHVLVPNEGAWTASRTSPTPIETAEVVTHDSDEPGEILLQLSTELVSRDKANDNSADRDLMRGVLGALWSHLRRLGVDVSDDGIAEIIDRHAPLGSKKKLFFVHDRDAAILHDLQLSPVRRVQEADISTVEEWIGGRLAGEDAFAIGPVASSTRTALLNHVVEELFQELKQSIRDLSEVHLLETLISHNESLIRAKRFVDMTLATERACYRDEHDMIVKRVQDLEELTGASIASRFLIEYVAARPPMGRNALSLGAYDRLLAMAARIHALGRLSDWVKYLDADVVLGIAPSGQLLDSWASDGEAMEHFVDAFAAQELQRATRRLSDYHESDRVDLGEEYPARLNRAMDAEFQFTADEMASFVGAALRVQDDVAAACHMGGPAFVSSMDAQLDWGERRIRSLLDLLSLKRRRSYLKPASPFFEKDVYPWLFNRRLSYVRRPFIVRPGPGGSNEVLWGPRNLQLAWVNLGGLILNGRLAHDSKEMERFIQGEVKKASADFVQSVAEVFRSIEGAVVRTNVSRIPGAAESLRPYGDIDVLVATPQGRLLACECKCVGQARTPHELRNEIGVFLKKDSGYIAKHLRRVEWAKREAMEIAAWLGVRRSKAWSVEGLVIVDAELMVAHMGGSALPIQSLDACRWQLEQKGAVLGRTP